MSQVKGTMEDQRVVVTGLGAVSPLGVDQPGTWDGFVAGRSGLGPITLFDRAACGIETRVAGEVRDFDLSAYFDRREARRLDRVAQFALVAAREALGDAGLLDVDSSDRSGLDERTVPPERVGVFIGTGLGGIGTLIAEQQTLHARGARRVSPFLIPMYLPDSVAGAVAAAFGLKGPNMAHLSACASGSNAIGEALEAIRRGAADVMVAGGSEAGITPLIVAGFGNMGALSKWDGEPALASRPFDAERDGFVVGEGAGILVLERLVDARARGASVYAELVGYGSTADAGHITAPAEDGGGMLRAIRLALADAQLEPRDIQYVNAHGTSTQLNDAVETLVLEQLLGPSAYDVPVSSVKSMIGHLLGAGGAVEAVATVRSVETGIIPPTINLHTPDPACDLDYVPHKARRVEGGIHVALSSSMGFGGHNAALLFGRVQPD